MLPNHISSSCCSASITSTFASLPIASSSPVALTLQQLHLLLLDCIHVQPQPFWKVPSSPCNCPLFSCKVWGSSKVQGHASLWSVSPPNLHTLPLITHGHTLKILIYGLLVIYIYESFINSVVHRFWGHSGGEGFLWTWRAESKWWKTVSREPDCKGLLDYATSYAQIREKLQLDMAGSENITTWKIKNVKRIWCWLITRVSIQVTLFL